MASITMNPNFRFRSERIESQPDRLNHFAKYSSLKYADYEMTAQYTNISETGMGVIARKQNSVRPGDLVKIKFNLPDTDETLTREGEVVRTDGEYYFAIEFTDLKGDSRKTFSHRLHRYAQFLSRPKWIDRWEKVVSFVNQNRVAFTLGLGAMVIGVILGGFMISYSYSHQDPMNSWGKIPHVKELRWKNFKKFISEAI